MWTEGSLGVRVFLRVTHGSLICGLGESHQGPGYGCGVWDPMGVWRVSHDWRLSVPRLWPGVWCPHKAILDVGHPQGAVLSPALVMAALCNKLSHSTCLDILVWSLGVAWLGPLLELASRCWLRLMSF